MKQDKFKVGDSVRVLIVGMDGFYTIDEINEDKVKLCLVEDITLVGVNHLINTD